MSVVVDPSVLVTALLDTGPKGGWAEGVLVGGSLHAPELVRAEALDLPLATLDVKLAKASGIGCALLTPRA